MDLKTQIILYLGIYFLSICILSIYLSRKQSDEDFLISGRNRWWISIAMSKYATSIGATWFITYTAFIYQFGIWVLWMIVGYAISMLIMAYYLTPKLHDIAKKEKFLQIWDIVKFKTQSSFLSRLTNFVSVLIQFLWLLVTIVGGTSLISHFGILSYEIALISIVAIVFLYLNFIGYKGIVTTDILQAFMVLIILWLMSAYLFRTNDMTLLMDAKFENISFATMMGFLIYWLFSTFSFSDRFQLLYSGSSEKSIKKWLSRVIPLIIFSVVMLLIIATLMRIQDPWLDPSIVFVRAIEIYLPMWLIPIAIVMFFASVMSSFDSYIFSISSHINVFKTKDLVRNIKLNAFILSLLAIVICFFLRDIIILTVIAAGASLILSIPMIYLFFWKNFAHKLKSPSKFFFSLIFSILWIIVWILAFGLSPDIAVFPLIFWVIWLTLSSKNLDNKLCLGWNK